MADSGYDERAMVELMHILAEGNPAGQPESVNTLPIPENRIDGIPQAIQALCPIGVPAGLNPESARPAPGAVVERPARRTCVEGSRRRAHAEPAAPSWQWVGVRRRRRLACGPARAPWRA